MNLHHPHKYRADGHRLHHTVTNGRILYHLCLHPTHGVHKYHVGSYGGHLTDRIHPCVHRRSSCHTGDTGHCIGSASSVRNPSGMPCWRRRSGSSLRGSCSLSSSYRMCCSGCCTGRGSWACSARPYPRPTGQHRWWKRQHTGCQT